MRFPRATRQNRTSAEATGMSVPGGRAEVGRRVSTLGRWVTVPLSWAFQGMSISSFERSQLRAHLGQLGVQFVR